MGVNRPDWPRTMKRGTAAAYCDLTPADFDREVLAGKLPLPFVLGNDEHWSRIALDEYIANLAGEGASDWRSKQPAYARPHAA